MQEWNPELYRQFEDERTRPAQELLARIPLTTAYNITDLGCGPGNSTALLVDRYPEARVTGVDTSPSMLASARARLPGCNFIEQDAAVDCFLSGGTYWYAVVPIYPLPPALSIEAPGAASDPDNPLLRDVGWNYLKGRLRSHPDVAERYYSALLWP